MYELESFNDAWYILALPDNRKIWNLPLYAGYAVELLKNMGGYVSLLCFGLRTRINKASKALISMSLFSVTMKIKLADIISF